MHVMTCNRCKKDSPAHRYRLQKNDLDIKIKCLQCKGCTPLRVWNCSCGKPWHVCQKHAIGEAVPKIAALQPRRISRKNSSKKSLSNAPFEQIRDDDLSNEAKRARLRIRTDFDQVISFDVSPSVSGLRATMLPPKLRERFASSLGSQRPQQWARQCPQRWWW